MPSVKIGTLRFWGEWFGRPYENWHQIIGADAEDDVLRLLFNEGETLTIWAPASLELERQVFRIAEADHVRWEWHSYGHPKTPENRFFMDFVKSADSIVATTNANWYERELKPTLSAAAVEIL